MIALVITLLVLVCGIRRGPRLRRWSKHDPRGSQWIVFVTCPDSAAGITPVVIDPRACARVRQ